MNPIVSPHTLRPKQPVIRRQRRGESVIDLPPAPKQSKPPQPKQYAKTFAGALGIIVIVGTILLATPWTTESGERTPFVDALFTAVSASAVTGLVTVDTGTHWNFAGEFAILILMQAGGLGFMVGASVVFQLLRRGARRLKDDLVVKEGAPVLSLREAVDLSRRIVYFTFAVEIIGMIPLTLAFWQRMPFLDALWYGIFHSVSAFCNAGFDLTGNFSSLGAYQTNVVINIVVMILIQLGALSYIVLEDIAVCRRWTAFELDTKLVLAGHAILALLGTVAFLVIEWNNVLRDAPVASKPMTALFHSITARSGGLATVNWSEVHTVTAFLWTGLMLVGGAASSTAGGVKLSTVGVVAASVLSTIKGHDAPQIFRRRISTELVFRAMSVIVIMMMLHFVVTSLLALTEDYWARGEFSFLTLMFETMSALATCGLSAGITPSLSTAGKLVLCVTMFVGRLGPLTAAYALQRRQRPMRYRFPVSPVRIG